MIVKKVLDIIDAAYGPIFVINNKVIGHQRYRGWFTTIVTLKDNEVAPVVALLKRNNHFETSTSWIEFMEYSIDLNLNSLNSEHYHQYYVRGRDLIKEDGDYYYVSIWFDNHMDFDDHMEFKIPKSQIKREELDKFLH